LHIYPLWKKSALKIHEKYVRSVCDATAVFLRVRHVKILTVIGTAIEQKITGPKATIVRDQKEKTDRILKLSLGYAKDFSFASVSF